MMLICVTKDCLMGVEEHSPHPDGIPVFCGICGQQMVVKPVNE